MRRWANPTTIGKARTTAHLTSLESFAYYTSACVLSTRSVFRAAKNGELKPQTATEVDWGLHERPLAIAVAGSEDAQNYVL